MTRERLRRALVVVAAVALIGYLVFPVVAASAARFGPMGGLAVLNVMDSYGVFARALRVVPMAVFLAVYLRQTDRLAGAYFLIPLYFAASGLASVVGALGFPDIPFRSDRAMLAQVEASPWQLIGLAGVVYAVVLWMVRPRADGMGDHPPQR